MAKYVVELSAMLKCKRTFEADSEEEALRLVGEALCDDDFNLNMWSEMLESDYEQTADHNVGRKVVGTASGTWVDWPKADANSRMMGDAKEVWAQLEDVPVDDNDCIDEDFYSRELGCTYPKGTYREDIWHDIEDILHVSVAYLMGVSTKPMCK